MTITKVFNEEKFKRTLDEGYHWLQHPVHGTIIIKVEKGLIYQMATIATRQANDPQFNNMMRQRTDPPNFEYKNELSGWF